jgi:hypothetical protein
MTPQVALAEALAGFSGIEAEELRVTPQRHLCVAVLLVHPGMHLVATHPSGRGNRLGEAQRVLVGPHA